MIWEAFFYKMKEQNQASSKHRAGQYKDPKPQSLSEQTQPILARTP